MSGSPRRRIHVLLNPGARQVGGTAEIERAYAAVRSEVADLRIEECTSGSLLAPSARAAAERGADVVVAAGGDGTLNAVARGLVGGRAALGVLALGTFNHFAKDLGLPLDLEEAVATTVRGPIREVDVGLAGDRPFLNTATMGVYFDAVTTRERWQPRVGKLLATIFGVLHVLRHPPLLKLDVRIDGRPMRARVPVLWAGNNRYAMQWPEAGKRSRLDEGVMTLVLVHQTSRLAFARQVLRVLVGRTQLARDIDVREVREIVVSTRGSLRIALDGERLHLRSPLTLRVQPRALRVVAGLGPAAQAG